MFSKKNLNVEIAYISRNPLNRDSMYVVKVVWQMFDVLSPFLENESHVPH